MNKNSLIFILVFNSISLAYSQEYDIARLLGSVSGEARAQGVVQNSGGYLYTKGVFSGGLKIGTSFYQAKPSDAFIYKSDINGNFQWFRRLGFTNVENASVGDGDIAIDASGNLYLIGSYTETTTIEGNVLTNLGGYDIYVAKYDPNGNLQWIRSIGGDGTDGGNAIAVDAAGAVYISGATQSTTFTFNGTPQTPGTSSSTQGAFFARLNPDGTGDWIQFIVTASQFNKGNDVTVVGTDLYVAGKVDGKAYVGKFSTANGSEDWSTETAFTVTSTNSEVFGISIHSGSLYIAGDFESSSLQFFGLPALNNQGGEDIFLASLDLGGNPLNSVSFGSAGNEAVQELSVAGTGVPVVSVTGYYSSALTLGVVTLPAAVSRNPFVANFSDVLAPAGAVHFATEGSDSGLGIFSNQNDDDIFVTGTYQGRATINGSGDYTCQKTSTFFIQRYSLSGLALDFGITSPKGEAVVVDVATDAADNIYLTGYFDGTVDVLGSEIISSEWSDNESTPLHDLFIAKLKPDASVDWISTAGSLGNDNVMDITLDDIGSVYFNALFPNNPTIAGVVLGPAETGNAVVKLNSDGSYGYAKAFGLNSGQVTAIQGDVNTGGDAVFVTGFFDGTVNLQGNNLSTFGGDDIFLARLDASGNLAAADLKQYGSTNNDQASALALRPSTDLLLTGFARDAINFDGINLSPLGSEDVIVASFDNTLTATSAFLDGGTNSQYGKLITRDPSGNIIVAGDFDKDAVFSSIPVNGSSESMFHFIASYQSNGTINWVTSIRTIDTNTSGDLLDLATDGNDFVYLTGEMRNSGLNFGGTGLPVQGDNDGFFVRYDNAGNVVFMDAVGSSYAQGAEPFRGFEQTFGMAVTSLNEVWITGTLSVKPETFGTLTLTPYSVDAPGLSMGMDSYLVRYNTNPASSVLKIYWTEEVGNQINRSNLDGTNFVQYYTGFSIFPQGIAHDHTTSFTYWTDTNGKVRKGKNGPSAFQYYTDFIDQSSGGQRDNLGIALDVMGDKIYWVSNWDGTIKTATLSAPVPISTMQTPVTGLNNPRGIALDLAGGKLYYTENLDPVGPVDNEASIHQANLDGSNDVELFLRPASGDDFHFTDIKLDVANNRIYWSGGPALLQNSGEIFRADISDIPGTVTSFATLGEPGGIDLDLSNGKIYWIDKGIISSQPARLMRANLDGSGQEILREGVTQNLFKPNFLSLDLQITMPLCTSVPAADAGTDQTLCAGTTVSLSGSITNVTAATWSTLGDGTFSDASSPTSTYTPGSNDISNGTVQLTLTTTDPDGSGACMAAVSSMTTTLQPLATTNAGADQAICPGNVANMTGTMGGSATNPVWSTSGTGTFGSTSALTTTYSPSPADVSSGSVTLTLTVNSTGVCPVATDPVTLTFSQPVVAGSPSAQGNVGQPANINVVASSTTNAGDVLTVTILQNPVKGTAVVQSNNSITYTASNGTVGADSFQYRICNQCNSCSNGNVTIDILNVPPVITPPAAPLTVVAGQTLVIPFNTFLSDINSNIDYSTLAVTGGPTSNAPVSFDTNYNLIVDYSTTPFAGTDQLTVQVCDLSGACSQVVLQIEVSGEITAFNGISPNDDGLGLNDYFRIENIEFLEPENRVSIYTRWGDRIAEIENYDNAGRRFEGVGDNGKEIVSGTYFYKIEFFSGRPAMTGYLVIKR